MLANGGDLDGDGSEELVMGLPRMGHSPNKAGRVEVLWGGNGSEGGAGGAAWTNVLTYPKDPLRGCRGTTVGGGSSGARACPREPCQRGWESG
jgi:hypothetical protein